MSGFKILIASVAVLLLITTVLANFPKYNETEAKNMLKVAYGAYCDKDDGGNHLKPWNCDLCKEFPLTIIGTYVFKDTNNSGYIGFSSATNEIVVGFRGTRLSSMKNVIQDLKTEIWWEDYPSKSMVESWVKEGPEDYSFIRALSAGPEEGPGSTFQGIHKGLAFNDFSPNGMKVAASFQSGLAGMRALYNKDLKATIEAHPGATVVFSGHSLGGALATLGALDVVLTGLKPTNKVKVYTYGEPRLGNSNFAEWATKLIHVHRFTNWEDAVPHYPIKNEFSSSSNTYMHEGYEYFLHPKAGTTLANCMFSHHIEVKECKDGLEDESCATQFHFYQESISCHRTYFGIEDDCTINGKPVGL